MGNAIISNKGGGSVLLWTNPSPTSNFTEQQVALDLSGYTFVGIELYFGTNQLYDENITIFRIPSGNGSTSNQLYAYGMVRANNNLQAIGRKINKITTDGVYFSGESLWNGETSSSRGIPIKIWGIR